jgi:hypothetical protein
MRILNSFLIAVLTVSCASAADPVYPTPPGPWQKPPKLGKPEGHVVFVSTEAELVNAVVNIRSGTTILIKPGTYELTRTLQITGGVKNVSLRGATDERDKVVIKGKGMANKNYGNVPDGIMLGNVTDVLIANLSIGDVKFHPISLHGELGCKRVRMFNLRLFDAGEQFIKSDPDFEGRGIADCIVEYCVVEFNDTSSQGYTQGMSVHGASNWIVRNNLFRNIRGPKHEPTCGGCIDFWKGSRNTTVEGNVIVNSRMGIRFGIEKRGKGSHDHEGGIVRNNLIWRQPGAVNAPDGGIMIWDSPGTKVLNNTVVLNGTFSPGVIEYRWSDGVVVANNLIDGPVWKREEAEGKEENNVRIVDREILADVAKGDLRLTPKAEMVLNKLRTLADCPRDATGKKRSEETAPGAYDYPAKKAK